MAEMSPPIEAYLYSIKLGYLTVNQGVVVKSDYHGCLRFFGHKQRVLCPEEPGEVFGATLWLPEKDDKEALRLLIASEERRVYIPEIEEMIHKRGYCCGCRIL